METSRRWPDTKIRSLTDTLITGSDLGNGRVILGRAEVWGPELGGIQKFKGQAKARLCFNELISAKYTNLVTRIIFWLFRYLDRFSSELEQIELHNSIRARQGRRHCARETVIRQTLARERQQYGGYGLGARALSFFLSFSNTEQRQLCGSCQRCIILLSLVGFSSFDFLSFVSIRTNFNSFFFFYITKLSVVTVTSYLSNVKVKFPRPLGHIPVCFIAELSLAHLQIHLFL